MDHSSVLPRNVSYHLLKEMTNDFSEELGRGTYGKVYLGLDKDGEKIAVKMLRPMLGPDDGQFEREYRNLERLQHRNIVRLVGYCDETTRGFVPYEGKNVHCEVTHKALCFEYMRNGSLDSCLSDESSGHDWNTRYAIIKGICNGLQYLHEELSSPIFHLDLKPANVLLDEHMVAKIADLGLSRLMGEEMTCITTSDIGTIGYLPPEYINHHVISNKLDIFSLGVIIIKIMAGRAGYSRIAEISSLEFTDLVHANWRIRLQAASVDDLESYCEQIKRCITIALTCVEADRHKRPTIGDIVKELNETETMVQFYDALQYNSWSSMDQENHQTYVTEEEEEEEMRTRNILSNTDNLFGEIVDNYKLNKMVKYMGKPKMRKDRAREALILGDEDGKASKASNYVHPLLPILAHMQGTLCLIYNATGETLYQVTNHDWHGRIDGPLPPTEIRNGQWAAFWHLCPDILESIGAVVYRGKDKDGEDQDYLLAWSRPLLFTEGSSKCYCEIGVVDNFQTRWHSLEEKLKESTNSSNAKFDGCEIHARIDTVFSQFNAIIRFL